MQDNSTNLYFIAYNHIDLSRILIDYSDHGWDGALFLDQIQTGSVGVRSVPESIFTMKFSSTDGLFQERFSRSTEYRNLKQFKRHNQVF